jgi:hypothetical protein
MSKAEKLLEDMRASKHGWGPHDLFTLYTGFGFTHQEGRRHTLYKHPKYSFLRATVARHSRLAVGYIEDAIDLVDKLKQLENPK